MGGFVGWVLFAQKMSCYLETAVCKGNICVIKAFTNYRVITLSPGLLNRNSLSLSLSAMLMAVLQCLTFSVLEPLWGKFTTIWSARGLLTLSLIVMSV